MASFGAKYPCFAPIATEPANALPTYTVDDKVTIGKLVKADLTVNLATGELYADDTLAESVSEFASGSIAMETDDMDLNVASKVYGATLETTELTDNIADAAPVGGLAYYKRVSKSGVVSYIGCFYPKVKASLGGDSASTKGSSVTFTTAQTTFTVYAANNGDWRKRETFTTEAEAKAWVDECLGVTVSGG